MKPIQIRPANNALFEQKLDIIARFNMLEAELVKHFEARIKVDEDGWARVRTVALFVNDGADELVATIIDEVVQAEDGTYIFRLLLTATADEWDECDIDIFKLTKVYFPHNMPVHILVSSQTTSSQHYTYAAEIVRFQVGDVY
jgi:hypothetical protein